MPLYEYECESCGTRFERIQKFSDPPVTVCPECGGAVRKLLSSPAIQFKGSGFYITDYAKTGGAEKSGGIGKTASDKSGEKTESTSATESKTADAKPAEPAAKPAKTGSE
jgi:putative FmdB family regulatory protein